jgi:hypothetical protein
LPKPIYLQVHPITVLQSLTLQRFYYFKPKIERPVESEGNCIYVLRVQTLRQNKGVTN